MKKYTLTIGILLSIILSLQLNGKVKTLSFATEQVGSPFDLSASYQFTSDNPNDLIFATYLQGNDGDFGADIALDSAGNAYVTGWTWSTDFPTTPGAFDTSINNIPDSFVAKVSPNGEVIYSTFLGGAGRDCSPSSGCAIAVDGDGNVYVTGITTSSDFPVTDGAYDTSHNGATDVFVTKLSADGSDLIYSTFLGTNDTDYGLEIAVDENGNAYVVGFTGSPNFPVTSGAFDTTYNGGLDVFVSKLNNTGTGLIYSTFIGGSSDDCVEEYFATDATGHDSCTIVLDDEGYVYIAGSTLSNNFPTTPGVFDATYNGDWDGFILKLNSNGSSLIYSTYVGGNNFDNVAGIAIDNNRNAYIVGRTYSADFPTTIGAFDNCLGITPPCETQTNPDAFALKLSHDGTMLHYATYIGGDYRDFGHGIVVDSEGKATVLARTEYDDFPTTPGAYDTSHNGDWDGAIVRLNQNGSQIEYGTFFGPGGQDFSYGHAIASGNNGHVYVTGNSGYGDVVIARFAMGQTCEVPFFSQRDTRWINHPLRTNGRCSISCNTLGACGCTLTSATMLFAHYGAELTPPDLSDGLGTSACPFDWLAAAANSENQADWVSKQTFSYQALEDELNLNQRPVILGMHKSDNSNDTHWVLVTEGQGDNPANYIMHDPWFLGGSNMKLSVRSNQGYVFDWISTYSGTPACSNIVVKSQNPSPKTIVPVSFSVPGTETENLSDKPPLHSLSVVTGSVFVYHMTEITMTLTLTATSSTSNITEMQIWTDNNPNPDWQPFAQFVWLPASDTVYVRFRDNLGNVSDDYSDTIFPIYSPPPEADSTLFLPMIMK